MFEVLIIVVVLLLIFGAGKVRNAGSDLGTAVRGFRRSLRGPQPDRPLPPAAGGAVDPAAADGAQPDAEFPEVLAARARGNGKPGA
jgi:sec-independent protein translocase protein TatA